MGTNSFCFEEIFRHFSQSDSAKILSLDCFDTLFWRRVDKPHDVFSVINREEGPSPRAKAEEIARFKALFNKKTAEVTLHDIYNEMSKFFDGKEIEHRVQEEIDAEIKFGFIYQPALSLLKVAKEKRIRTIIVSDIYLSSDQLGYLIKNVSPETFSLIDKIYTSSDVGCGKANGLWKYVIKNERVQSKDIFHIGDNINADFKVPSKTGISAFHFKQNEKIVMHIMEQRRIAASLLFSDYQNIKAVPSFFHDWYSTHVRDNITAEKTLGFTVLGPALFGFCQHIKKQSAKYSNVKIGFLMRDGYMPKLAYDVMFPSEDTYSLRISRLTSICSSFTCKKSIEDYLIKTLSPFLSSNSSLSGNDELINVTFKHLLISETNKEKIKQKLREAAFSVYAFIEFILSEKIIKEIINNSEKYRNRLVMHIKNEMDLKKGETLMLIDLGYEGTTQNRLSDILEKELGIFIVGCYMIVAHTPDWKKNRTGLITPENYDWRVILSLTNHIASFELLCSSNDNSVVDYDLSGNPVYESNAIAPSALDRVKEIQYHAISFVESNSKNIIMHYGDDGVTSESVISDLARFIYFPTIDETKFFENLTFEINLGSKKKVSFLDRKKSINYIAKHGISRLVDSGGDFRTNYPSELRYLGIDYAISLLSSYRHSIDFLVANSVQRRDEVEVLYVDGNKTFSQKIESKHTFDGFYSLYIPVITTEVIIMIGRIGSMIEIMDFSFIQEKYFSTSSEDNDSREIFHNIDYAIDGGEFNEGVISGLKESSFIYMKMGKSNEIIRLVYRKLVGK
ncbi:hypothetical protein PEC301899_08550 [Pectobacterium carotovorum subsp. carotovorum]|nr:hypothetical protein PEC301899_08550 [Pectobacterium carotovorum subsp. carotovorum]